MQTIKARLRYSVWQTIALIVWTLSACAYAYAHDWDNMIVRLFIVYLTWRIIGYEMREDGHCLRRRRR